MNSLKSQNYYDILGVGRQASAEEIRSAYEISRHTFRENSLATYSLFSDQENREILDLIAKAFQTLFNSESRRAYDAVLQLQEGETPAAAGPGGRAGVAGNPATFSPGSHGARPGGAGLQGAAIRSRPEGEGARRATAPMPAGAPIRPENPRPGAAASFAALSPAARAVPAPTVSTASPTPPLARPAVSAAVPKPAPVAQAPAPTAARDELLQTVARFDGATLKRVRLSLGISLEDLAERSKIRRAYLEYIEEEDFQFLPAPVYVKGFVTLMANFLGLPAQRVADDYMQIYRAKRP
ncbi:MAG: helix-turn-helix domain-containing protein [SAR324 cluster bacterium]